MSSKERTRRWREKHRNDPSWMGRQREYERLRYQKNPEKKRAAARKHRQQNPEKEMFSDAKRRATKRNLEFNIELSDVIIPEVCPLLGLPIHVSEGQSDNSPSLDRIDSSKGYIKGNIWVICWRANKLKSDATLDELEKLTTALRLKLQAENV